MYGIINRLRGCYQWGGWIGGVFTGLLVLCATQNPLLSISTSLAYVAGESMRWGEWVGGLIRQDGQPADKRSGENNGIQWLASNLFTLDSTGYHFTALAIRGLYWWLPVFAVLSYHYDLGLMFLSSVLLAMMFPVSVLVARECSFTLPLVTNTWERAEVIYGGFQDLIPLAIVISMLF